MSELAVVNASPLICLGRAGLGHLLRHAAESIVVPLSVSREILARGAHDVTAAFVASTSRLNQVDDPKIPDGILAWDLGRANLPYLRTRLIASGHEPSSMICRHDDAQKLTASLFAAPWGSFCERVGWS